MADQTVSFRIQVQDDGSFVLQRIAGGLENLQKSAVKAEAGFSRFGAKTIEINQGLELLRKGIEGAKKAFEFFIGSQVEAGTQMLNLSRRFNVGVEEFSKFAQTAKAFGVPVEGLGFAFRGMATAIVKAQQVGSPMSQLFQKLGLDAKQLGRELPTQQMVDILKAFARFRDDPNLVEAMRLVFQRGIFNAQQLRNILKTDRAEFEETFRFFSQKGQFITKEQAEAAETIDVALNKVQGAFSALRRAVVNADTMNAVGHALEAIAKVMSDPRTLESAQRLGEHVAKLVDSMAQFITVENFSKAIDSLTNLFRSMDEELSRVEQHGIWSLLFNTPQEMKDAAIRPFTSLFGASTVAPFPSMAAHGTTGFADLIAMSAHGGVPSFAGLVGGGTTAGDQGPSIGTQRTEAQIKALQNLRDKEQELRDKIAVLTQAMSPAQAEADKLTIEFTKLGKAAGENVDQDKLLIAQLPQLTQLQEANAAITKEQESATKKGVESMHDMYLQLQVLKGALTDNQAAAIKFANGLANADDQIKSINASEFQQVQQLTTLKKGFEDFFGAIENSVLQVMDALIAGTRNVAQAFDGLKLALIKAVGQAVLDSIKTQLVQQGSNILGGLLGPQRGGGSLLGSIVALIGGGSSQGGAGLGGAGLGASAAVGGYLAAVIGAAINTSIFANRLNDPHGFRGTSGQFGLTGSLPPAAAGLAFSAGRPGLGIATLFGGGPTIAILGEFGADPFGVFPSREDLQQSFIGQEQKKLIEKHVFGALPFGGIPVASGTGQASFGNIGAQPAAFGAVLAGFGPGGSSAFAVNIAKAAEKSALDLLDAFHALGITAEAAIQRINRVFNGGRRQVDDYAKAVQGLVEIFTQVSPTAALRITNQLLKDGVASGAEMTDVMKALGASIATLSQAFANAGGSATSFIRAVAQAGGAVITTDMIRGLFGTPNEPTALGSALTEPFFEARRALHRARRPGSPGGRTVTAGEFASIASGLGTGAAASGQAIAAAAPLLKAAADAGLKFAVELQVAAGDMQGATGTIMQDLQPFIDLAKGFKQLGQDIRSRTAFALAGPGFPGQQAAIDALTQQRIEAQAALGGLTKEATPENLDILKTFTDLRLSELEAELALARDMKSTFTDVSRAFQSIRDQVAIFRNPLPASAAIVAREQGQIAALLPTALNPNSPDEFAAIQFIQQTLPQLFQLGQSTFGPGSSQMLRLLEFIDTVAQKIGDFATQQAAAAAAKERDLQHQVHEFADAFAPLISWYEQNAQFNLQTEFTRVETLLGDGGPISQLLHAIARHFNVDISTVNPNPTHSNVPLTGPGGPSLGFPPNLPIHTGAIVLNNQVTVTAAIDPKTTGNMVAEALVTRAAPRLVSEVRRVVRGGR